MKNFIVKLSLSVLLFSSLTTFSQSFSKAKFKEYFTQGNLMMMDNFYDTAVRTFLTLHKFDPANANINYKIGVCYLHLPAQKSKSIPFLVNAIRQTTGTYREDEPGEKNAPEDALYYLGQAYHYTYQFDEAIAQFNKFREIVGKWNLNLVKDIDHWIEVSKNAKELTSKPVDCTITNLGDSVNSEFADYSPVISADESMLAFTSRRMGTGGPDNKTIDDSYFEDIWVCSRSEYGTWRKAKGISRIINTDGNEATIGLSADGQQLYVYRDDNGDGNIYISKLDGDFWNAPYKMDASNVNSTKWEPSACISADGNTLYFVSNRSGGFGGRDIYQCHRLPNRSWSEPENLGPTINTPYDEDAPFIHPDGVTFFFSSTGHNSMGGFDIYYSTKVANNVWTKPVNMGYPINTTDDDIYFVTSSDGRRAYYASFRPEGKGEKDIYMVSMPKPFVKSVAILVGWLKNRDGSFIPQNSLVTVTSSKGAVTSSKPNEASGKFIQSLFPGQEYEISIETNGNKVFYDKFFLPMDSSYLNLGRGFFKRTIYLGDTTRLFSMNKVSDTTSRTNSSEMEGRILLSENPNDPAQNLSIQLLNPQGNIIASTITDSKGNFKFPEIPSGQKYIIKVDENDPLTATHNKFYLANNEGKVIMPSAQEGRFFLFKNLRPDINDLSKLELNDNTIAYTAMMGKLFGNDGKKALPNAKLKLEDASGKVLLEETTDRSGNFAFEKIPSDKSYSISINEKDQALKNNSKIYLANQKDEIIKKVEKMADYFIFRNLPADLNKLSAIDMTDSSHLIAMKGKILKSNNPSDGIPGLEISLLDNKGKLIQKTKTDNAGAFRSEKISTESNYSIKLDEKDSLLASVDKVYLANEADKVVKAVSLNKKMNSFNNLPANLLQMTELKEHLLTQENKMEDVPQKTFYNSDDAIYDFVVYFTYNKKDIDISINSFMGLMEKVAKTINQNGNAKIIIAASSSTVPTSSFSSNEALSNLRANEIKDKVHASMSLRNLDDSKISYDISTKVQGPVYNNDAVQKRKEYEKWQFVKVIVQ
jgi:hypothetical protein